MEWNKKFNYPSSTRALIQGKRHYSLDGSNLPSVTTILSATKSEEDKAALAAWKERVGKLEADRIKKEASSRGSSIHKFIEEFLHGKLNQDLINDNKHTKKMAEEIIDNGLKNKLTEVWGAEATLYYPNKYAGTADCIGVYEGRETILDFKQSNKPKKKEYIEDCGDQHLGVALCQTQRGAGITRQRADAILRAIFALLHGASGRYDYGRCLQCVRVFGNLIAVYLCVDRAGRTS